MLKTDFPIYFDETELPIKHRQWRLSYQNITNVNETEGGTDSVEVVRTGKVAISAAFRCTDVWAAVLVAFNSHQSIQVKYYDIATMAYITKTMRITGMTATEVARSDRLAASNGIYDIQLSLLEF